MKLIAQVKLQPSPAQAEALRQTMLAYNDAANYISDQAWQRKVFRAYDLHHATYYAVRERFGLSAQLAIRVIKDVTDAYKLDTKTKRAFRRMGSVTYDSRVLRWFLTKSEVTIWTMQGRQRIPFVCGERQRQMLETLQGEADLVHRNGEWYLHQPCNIVEDDRTWTFTPLPRNKLPCFSGEYLTLAKVAPDGEGEPLWFRMDGEDWVLCDEPTCYRLQDER